jgi:spore germination protein KC
MKKTAILLVLLGWLVTTASGCWDQIELDKRTIIMAVGIDKAEADGRIILTFQSIIPGRLADTMGDSTQNQAVRVVSSSGATVLEAAKNYQSQTNGIPYFLHNRLLVIGKELAREGVAPVMDYFIRNLQIQPRTWVLVAQGKAADILNWKSEASQISARYIADLLYCSSRQAVTAFATNDLHRFILQLADPTTSPITSGVEVLKAVNDQPPEIRICGTAVFKRDKLVGWLGLRETRGLLWITKQSTQGILETEYPRGLRRNIVQQVTRSSRKIKPQIRNGTVEIDIEVREEGNIGEEDGSIRLTNRKIIRSLEQAKALEIRTDIEDCLRKCQKEFGSDIFGFGMAVAQHYPREWKRLRKRWDRVFPHIRIKVHAIAKIRGTGLIADPINFQPGFGGLTGFNR